MDCSKQKITRRDFVVFGEDLNRHPHSLEHILKYYFQKNRFIWVETIGLRSPKFSRHDFKRIISKIQSWSSREKVIKRNQYKNVEIISPIMIPYNQFIFIRLINKWSVKRAINKSIKKQNFSNIITISSVPQAGDYIDLFPSKQKVYFCVDDFSLWPGVNHKLAEIFEKLLIKKSDLIIATSDELSKNKKKESAETQILTHGVDFEHFNIGKKYLSDQFKICYFGLIDERMDVNILLELSRKMPLIEIMLIGDITINKTRLLKQSNINCIGSIHYKELPLFIKEVDVFILPYKMNNLTKNICPLKLKEYLSTSRPVVSTSLPEVVKLKSFLHIAQDMQDFVVIVNEIMENKISYDPKPTIEYILKDETWISKNNELSILINSISSSSE